MQKHLIKIVLMLLGISSSLAQSIEDYPEDIKSKLDGLNGKIEDLFLKENTDFLLRYYDEELTYFPEFKPAIFSTRMLNQFYRDWFRQVEIRAYKKKIYKAEVFADCILEVGTFHFIYSYFNTPDVQSQYNGKYMVVWKKTKEGKLRILSEAFGADKYIEPKDVPYSKVRIIESDISPDNKELDGLLRSEIETQNTEVIRAVVNGDGNARSQGFTDDGIYMPHYESILSGMNIIKPYMLKTYSPKAKLRVRHTYYRIFDFGDLILINGHFDGAWGDETNGGVFTGNMSNLLKREHGKLLMYCQLVNNDK